MHEAVGEFIERTALMMEVDGLPRSGGRIFAFLLIHEGSYSLDELAEALQVSKASVSTNARILERMGVVQRVSHPGDRRDYYRMEADAWERMMEVGRRRWEAMREHLTVTAASLPEDMEVGRRRVIRAEQFHLLMIHYVDQMLERWQQKVSELSELETKVS